MGGHAGEHDEKAKAQKIVFEGNRKFFTLPCVEQQTKLKRKTILRRLSRCPLTVVGRLSTADDFFIFK